MSQILMETMSYVTEEPYHILSSEAAGLVLSNGRLLRLSRTLPSPTGNTINADVITRRFRAEMAAFWREKEMIIFFASMAHHFSEHASQVVSRESVAALIPLEKHATLAQPLSQNTLKSARNFIGADNTLLLVWLGCVASNSTLAAGRKNLRDLVRW